MKDDGVIKAGESVLNDLNAFSSRLQNQILEAYNVEAVRMFARLHATDEETGAFDRTVYNDYIRDYQQQNDYNRFTFDSKREADNFANTLRSQSKNNDVVVAPISLNGKYFVETKGTVEMTDDKERTVQINSASMVSEMYERQTNCKAKVYNHHEDNYQSARENRNFGTIGTNMFLQAIENEQDEDVRKISKKIKRLSKELTEYAERTDSTAVLRSDTKRDKMGKETFNENTGTGVRPARGGVVDHQATAINFLNNRMVIVDGKLVTDSEKIEQIQHLHQERMATVDRASERIQQTNERVGRAFFNDEKAVTDRSNHKFLFSREQIKMQINAEGVRQRRIKQNYYSHTTYSGRDSSNVDSFRNSLGKEQIVMSNLETHILLDKSAVDAMNAYRNSKDYGKRVFTDSKLPKFSKREEETLEKITKYSNEKSEATFSAKLSAEDRINLNSIARKTAVCGEAYAVHGAVSGIPVSADATNALRDIERHTDIKLGDTDISEAFEFGGLGTYREIINLYDDLGIDLRFGEIEGKTLSSQQLMLGTDSRVLRYLETKGVVYDGTIGKFVDKATNTALDKAELENVFKSVNTDSNIISGFSEIGNQIKNNADINAKLFENINNAFNTNDIQNFFGGESKLDKALAQTTFGQEHGKSAMSFFEKAGEQYGFKIEDDGRIVHHREKADITRFDIIQIDKGFLLKMATPVVDKDGIKHEGLMLVRNGKIDIKAIKNLSKEELRLRGISESTRDMVVKLHTDKNGKYVEWGQNNYHNLGKVTEKLGQLTDNDKETMEVANMANQYYEVFSGKKLNEIKQTAKQFKDTARLSNDRLKMRLERHGINVPDNPLKNAKSAIKEKVKPLIPERNNPNIIQSGDIKKIEKRLLKEEKQIKKIQRSERRNTFLKRFDIKERIKEWFANTTIGKLFTKFSTFAKGLAVKAVVVFGQVYLILAGFVVVAVVVLSVIENLTGLPHKGLMAIADILGSGQNVAMVELYDFLDNKQNEWIKVSDSPKKLYENKEDLKYSLNYVDYKDYVKSIDGLVLIDDTLYLDPYYAIGSTDADIELRKDHLIEVDKFAGLNEYTLVANPSVYTAINSDADTDGKIISAESGHTSNIKDILAMTDVMYGYNMIECSDGSMESILSCKPAVINAEAYYQKGVEFLSWAVDCGKKLWKWFCSGFEDEAPELPKRPHWNDMLTYDTVLNYVTMLYDASHQNQFDISVDNFYPKTIRANGEQIELTREQASLFKSNANKREDKFDVTSEVNHNSGYITVYPCIKNADGTMMKINVDADLQQVQPIGNNYCLFNSRVYNGINAKMGGNEATYDFIIDNINNGTACWELDSTTEIKHELSATGDWKSSENEALEDAKDKISALIEENLKKDEFQKRYSLNGENNFTYTHYENNFSSRELTSSNIETKQDEAYSRYLPSQYWANGIDTVWGEQNWSDWTNRTDTEPFNFVAQNPNGETADAKDLIYPVAPYTYAKFTYDLYDDEGNFFTSVTEIVPASFGYDRNGNPWFTMDWDGGSFGDTGNGGTQYTMNFVTNNHSFSYTFNKDGGYKINNVHFTGYTYDDGGYNQGDDFTYQTIYYPKEYKATGTVDNAILEIQENYIRDCKGDGFDDEGNEYDESHWHKFSYYAPEVSIKSKGIVYSITNEQLAMSGTYSSEREYPTALDFNLEEKGYSEMKGNHIGTDNGKIDYTTAESAVNTSTGCGLPSITNPQGSITGNYGLNLLLDGSSWKSVDSGSGDNAIRPKDGISHYLLKDIFDIDCLLDKASNVFCYDELSQYEGWSGDNKTVATLKTSLDWNDAYDFDIPLEVGSASLAPDDIEWLNNALTIQYGENYTEEKKEVMNLLFKWIGRGHYSDEHNDHDFLSSACGNVSSTVKINGEELTDTFQVSCTAGDSVGFANYIRNAFNKSTFERSSSSGDGNLNDYHDLLPCDIIHQTPNINLSDILSGTGDDKTVSYLTDTLLDGNVNSVANLMKEVCAFYVGTFDNDAIFADCEDGATKTLLNGFVIKKGEPITIGMDNLVKKKNDVNNGEGCGTVFLRSKAFDVEENPKSINSWTNETDYFWLLYPNTKTYFRRW